MFTHKTLEEKFLEGVQLLRNIRKTNDTVNKKIDEYLDSLTASYAATPDPEADISSDPKVQEKTGDAPKPF